MTNQRSFEVEHVSKAGEVEVEVLNPACPRRKINMTIECLPLVIHRGPGAKSRRRLIKILNNGVVRAARCTIRHGESCAVVQPAVHVDTDGSRRIKCWINL